MLVAGKMIRVLLPFAVAVVASASCASHYTCCADTVFPVPWPIHHFMCVEEEPNGSDNCKRAGFPSVWKETRCDRDTPSTSRAELDGPEAKEREWQGNFTKFCVNNGAHCNQGGNVHETCYYDKRRDDDCNQGGCSQTFLIGANTHMGPQCVCEWKDSEEGGASCRANLDGTGACGFCNVPANTSKYDDYVKAKEGTGHKDFNNGECACAFGPRKPATKDSVLISI